MVAVDKDDIDDAADMVMAIVVEANQSRVFRRTESGAENERRVGFIGRIGYKFEDC